MHRNHKNPGVWWRLRYSVSSCLLCRLSGENLGWTDRHMETVSLRLSLFVFLCGQHTRVTDYIHSLCPSFLSLCLSPSLSPCRLTADQFHRLICRPSVCLHWLFAYQWGLKVSRILMSISGALTRTKMLVVLRVKATWVKIFGIWATNRDVIFFIILFLLRIKTNTFKWASCSIIITNPSSSVVCEVESENWLHTVFQTNPLAEPYQWLDGIIISTMNYLSLVAWQLTHHHTPHKTESWFLHFCFSSRLNK